ncbi:unnamed protein product [Ambrosiozyma monospora]|uniref:Unnamed protein product n=1 Tax=Ambrosiozyma monospora TaxID=43982 RepID=A0ACB5TC01_AMBMO|nr:unnamed protein product [Ambrosiozyma monospora]
MPSRELNYHKAHESLTAGTGNLTGNKYSQAICTSLGLTLLEIQGELNLPSEKPDLLTEEEEKLFIKTSIPSNIADTEEILRDAVKFGKLELDKDCKKATLFISKSQRLVGTVEKVDPPLGVLKVSKPPSETDGTTASECQIIDVINYKVIFKFRPLPIM